MQDDSENNNPSREAISVNDSNNNDRGFYTILSLDQIYALSIVAFFCFLAGLAKFLHDTGDAPIRWRMFVAKGLTAIVVGMIVYPACVYYAKDISGLSAVMIACISGTYSEEIIVMARKYVKSAPEGFKGMLFYMLEKKSNKKGKDDASN